MPRRTNPAGHRLPARITANGLIWMQLLSCRLIRKTPHVKAGYNSLSECLRQECQSSRGAPWPDPQHYGKEHRVTGRFRGQAAWVGILAPWLNHSVVNLLNFSEPRSFLSKMVIMRVASTLIGFMSALNVIIHIQCLRQFLTSKSSINISGLILTKHIGFSWIVTLHTRDPLW